MKEQIAITLSITSLVASLTALALSLWLPRAEGATGINGATFTNLLLIWIGIFSLDFRIRRLMKINKEYKGAPDTIGTDRS